jgi:proteasome accessory factor B
VRFAYRKPSGVESDREVEPWGVVSWRGRWYLVGHDRDRRAPRCFRLSRVLGAVSPVGPAGAVKVPTGIDLVGYVVATEPPEFHRFARVRVRRGQGTWLRKIAARIEPGERGSDWDVAEIGYDDPEWIADRVARQGSGAVVDEPVEVREAVVRRLRAHAGPARHASGRRATVAAGGVEPSAVAGETGCADEPGCGGAGGRDAPVAEGRR